jgi:hypothetical protein
VAADRDLHASPEAPPDATYDDLTDEQKRHDQLTRAPKSTDEDAAPRIVTSEGNGGATRIDITDTAAVRPGKGDDRTEP